MGATQSKDNDDLVDYLVNSKFLRTKRIEAAMRLVDRGRFLPRGHRGEAYRDSPLKVDEGDPGQVHLSAPCIYANVLEALAIEPGHSFLNIGSGSGWLNTVVGFLIESSGINHGIEVHSNLIDYSNEKVRLMKKGAEVSVYDWAEPSFFHGNGLSLSLTDDTVGYDRIYCGAALPESNITDIIKLLKVGGSMVAPVETRLLLYKRISESENVSTNISTVQFADLIVPEEDSPIFSLPSLAGPFSLRLLCRNVIRKHLREYAVGKSPILMRQLAKDLPPEEIRSPAPRVMLRVDWPNGRREEVHAPLELDDNDQPAHAHDDAIRIRLLAAEVGARDDEDNRDREHADDIRRWRILERLLGRTAAARRELRNVRREIEGNIVDNEGENGNADEESERNENDENTDTLEDLSGDGNATEDDGHLIFSDDSGGEQDDSSDDETPFLDEGTPEDAENTTEESCGEGVTTENADASDEFTGGIQRQKRRRVASSGSSSGERREEDIESKRRKIARDRQAISIRECGKLWDAELGKLDLSNNMKTYCRLGIPLPSNVDGQR